MNITAFEYEDSIIVVDCGLAFPEDDMLGIDLVIPDVTYLKDNIQKVKGFVITHGHEDHIGALCYVLREMNLPIHVTQSSFRLPSQNTAIAFTVFSLSCDNSMFSQVKIVAPHSSFLALRTPADFPSTNNSTVSALEYTLIYGT